MFLMKLANDQIPLILIIFVDYVEDNADPITNEDRFCLPTCMTKSEIYNTYVEEMRSAGVKPISLPTFSRMWKKFFRNVIILITEVLDKQLRVKISDNNFE